MSEELERQETSPEEGVAQERDEQGRFVADGAADETVPEPQTKEEELRGTLSDTQQRYQNLLETLKQRDPAFVEDWREQYRRQQMGQAPTPAPPQEDDPYADDPYIREIRELKKDFEEQKKQREAEKEYAQRMQMLNGYNNERGGALQYMEQIRTTHNIPEDKMAEMVNKCANFCIPFDRPGGPTSYARAIEAMAPMLSGPKPVNPSDIAAAEAKARAEHMTNMTQPQGAAVAPGEKSTNEQLADRIAPDTPFGG